MAVLLVLCGVAPGGCALAALTVWNPWEVATACDADEGMAVFRFVESRGVVPASAGLARSQTGSRRLLMVVGVEDRVVQAEILAAAAEARRLHSTKPVVVNFYAGIVVHDGHGGARFPGGTTLIRREVIE